MQLDACATEGPSMPGNGGTRSQPMCDLIINTYWSLPLKPPIPDTDLLNPVMSEGQGAALSTVPEFMLMRTLAGL